MDWEHYFKARPLSLERYINNVWNHKPFLIEITSSGQRMLEVGTGTGSLAIFLSHLGYDVISIDNNETKKQMLLIYHL